MEKADSSQTNSHTDRQAEGHPLTSPTAIIEAAVLFLPFFLSASLRKVSQRYATQWLRLSDTSASFIRHFCQRNRFPSESVVSASAAVDVFFAETRSKRTTEQQKTLFTFHMTYEDTATRIVKVETEGKDNRILLCLSV